jgi:hypothetical protein
MSFWQQLSSAGILLGALFLLPAILIDIIVFSPTILIDIIVFFQKKIKIRKV